jgi:dihydrofolate reductase
MGRIVVSDNVTVDGVMQDPAGDEGFEHGGWVGLIANRPELGRFALVEAMSSEAMLMGRRTYEWFAGRWPTRTGELADRLNSMPKFVVSSTIEAPTWANTTVLRGDLVDEVRRLKAELAGDMVVPASVRFVGTLLEHQLVDELRLRIFPVLLGAGTRLFGETATPQAMRLVESRTLDGDTAALTYQRIPQEARR